MYSLYLNLRDSPSNALRLFKVVHMALQPANKVSPCVVFTVTSDYRLVNSSVILQKLIYRI